MLNGKLRIAPTCYHVLHQVPVSVAHEMSYLYDEGLHDAEGGPAYELLHDSIVPFGLEKLGISQAMKEKSVDIALDVQSRTVFFQRARGADLYIIAGWRNQHTNVWIAPPGIRSLADLKGKRVGISDFNSIRHWAIQIQLKKAGLDPERDVEWVRIGVAPVLHMEAIRSGRVECAPVPTWRAEELRRDGCNVLVAPADQYPRGRPERVIAATGRILEQRPDMVKSFLKGMIRSYWFIRDMPRNHEYVTLLEKRLRLSSPDPEERDVDRPARTAVDLEAMPFPIDGKATGFEEMLQEEERLGELNYDVPPIREVCAQDLVSEAFRELAERKELEAEYRRARAVAEKWGY
ncbi:MAG TPA: ABC transporter substrate-binding protein [candidate division Zixibacteria bacterium]|nr:ABC transporter substrate-binding protein [candidate division Zixibacteria bacterium]